MMIISSVPKGADIYLNDILQKQKTTSITRLENLLPGDYDIKLSKEGYFNWEKRLPVYENATAFAEKVILWKKSSSTPIATTSLSQWLPTVDGQKIAFIDSTGIPTITNLDNEKIIIPALNQSRNFNLLGWSVDNKNLLLQSDDQFMIWDTSRDKNIFKTLPGKNYTLIKWDLTDENKLYGINASGLWQITLPNFDSKLISAEKITDSLIIDNDLYTINSEGKIFHSYLNGDASIKEINQIRCNDCKFINKKSARLILLGKDSQNIFIIDPTNGNANIQNQAKGVAWLDNSWLGLTIGDPNTILFFNDFEIWIYSFNKATPELVTRLGQPIIGAIWHNQGRHIIFSSDNKLQIIELDNRELRNIVQLTEAKTIGNINLSHDSKTLYYYGQLDNQSRIYKLPIQ